MSLDEFQNDSQAIDHSAGAAADDAGDKSVDQSNLSLRSSASVSINIQEILKRDRPNGGLGFFQNEKDEEKSIVEISAEMIEDAVYNANVPDSGRLLSLCLAGLRISNITRLNKMQMLRNLDLSYNRITSMKGLESLYQLRELKLSCNKISVLNGIMKLTALEALHLEINRVEAISKQSLRDNKKLKTLCLDGNSLTQMSGLDSLVMLTRLDVSQNKLTRLEGLGMLKCLESLSMSFNSIQVIEGMSALARLRELDLSNNQITSVQGLKTCVNLEILRLDHNAISDIRGLPRLPHLAELYISYNQVSSASETLLTVCPGLEFLDLSGNKLAELKEMEYMAGLTSLIDLKLEGNPICSFKGYEESVRKYLTAVDSLDNEDIRGARAQAQAANGSNATDEILDRGGVTLHQKREYKELASILTIEEFEQTLSNLREALIAARKNVYESIHNLIYAPQKPDYQDVLQNKAMDQIKNRDAGTAPPTTVALEYMKGEDAVAAAISKLRVSGERKLSLPGDESTSQSTNYLMSTMVQGSSRNLAPETPREGNQEHEAKAQEFEYSGALKQVNDKIHRTLQETTAALQLELEDDVDGASPSRTPPDSPTVFPTREQIKEMKELQDELKLRLTRVRPSSGQPQPTYTSREDVRSVSPPRRRPLSSKPDLLRSNSSKNFVVEEKSIASTESISDLANSRPGSSKVRERISEAMEFSETIFSHV